LNGVGTDAAAGAALEIITWRLSHGSKEEVDSECNLASWIFDSSGESRWQIHQPVLRAGQFVEHESETM
jgi:hypothetical protein